MGKLRLGVGKGLAAAEVGLGPWVWTLIPGRLCPHWAISEACCLQMACWVRPSFPFGVVYVGGGRKDNRFVTYNPLNL